MRAQLTSLEDGKEDKLKADKDLAAAKNTPDNGLESSALLDRVWKDADAELTDVNNILTGARQNDTSDEKWYQIWRHLYYTKKRANLVKAFG